MSGFLAGKVWLSALPRHLKPLAATLADLGDDDGHGIYPSVAYVAWRLSCSERAVQYGLDELRSIGVLDVISPTNDDGSPIGGRPGCTTMHRLNETKLPRRAPWRATATGATVAPVSPGTGALFDGDGCNTVPTTGEAGCTRSVSKSTREKKNRERGADAPACEPNRVIAHYHDRWRERYGAKAPFTAKNAGQLARVTRDYGTEQALEFVGRFFEIDDRFARDSAHSVSAFTVCLAKLVAATAPGRAGDESFAGMPGYGKFD